MNPMLQERIDTIRQRIQTAAKACDRKADEITLVAVSKTVAAERISEGIQCGLTTFGENYIQEAREKISTLSAPSVSWHFIGHLQRNKAKYAVRLFDLIHTVDSVKLAAELDKQARKIDKIQQVLLQVNVGMETSKSGVPPSEAVALARAASHFSNIRVRGLMTIPPVYDAPDLVAPYFRCLRELRDAVRQENIPGIDMQDLSMGMTGDFEVAIREGATLVRIGTAIFGERS
jgi:pyridoxal phosphate enzyme (YggS family)